MTTPQSSRNPSQKGAKLGGSEADFQKSVIDLAHRLGWRVVHFHKVQNKQGRWMTPVAADGGGWVDLELIRERIIHAELKTDVGQLTLEQAVWQDTLKKAGGEVYCWKPKDWDEIERTLKTRLVVSAYEQPDAVCRWLFEMMGCEPMDDLVDLFPGSGAVTRAWKSWCRQLSLLTKGDTA